MTIYLTNDVAARIPPAGRPLSAGPGADPPDARPGRCPSSDPITVGQAHSTDDSRIPLRRTADR